MTELVLQYVSTKNNKMDNVKFKTIKIECIGDALLCEGLL